ncbi:hypothetical protein BGZ73_006024, partial [Actinomortierella ambigua]
ISADQTFYPRTSRTPTENMLIKSIVALAITQATCLALAVSSRCEFGRLGRETVQHLTTGDYLYLRGLDDDIC